MENFIWKFASIIVAGLFPVFLTLKFMFNYLRQFLFNN